MPPSIARCPSAANPPPKFVRSQTIDNAAALDKESRSMAPAPLRSRPTRPSALWSPGIARCGSAAARPGRRADAASTPSRPPRPDSPARPATEIARAFAAAQAWCAYSVASVEGKWSGSAGPPASPRGRPSVTGRQPRCPTARGVQPSPARRPAGSHRFGTHLIVTFTRPTEADPARSASRSHPCERTNKAVNSVSLFAYCSLQSAES
jgi:hypothetical protein